MSHTFLLWCFWNSRIHNFNFLLCLSPQTPVMSPFCCHLRTHLALGYIRSVCTLTAHECRNISFFLCSETVLRDFLRKRTTNFKHLSKRDANYNRFRDQCHSILTHLCHIVSSMLAPLLHVPWSFTFEIIWNNGTPRSTFQSFWTYVLSFLQRQFFWKRCGNTEKRNKNQKQ